MENAYFSLPKSLSLASSPGSYKSEDPGDAWDEISLLQMADDVREALDDPEVIIRDKDVDVLAALLKVVLETPRVWRGY